MKKLMTALAACAAMTLAGCEQVTTEKIQEATAQVCGFVPTAIAVAGFIPQAVPYTGRADEIAAAICNAVVAQKAHRRGGAPLTVGVVLPNGTAARVTGHFVR